MAPEVPASKAQEIIRSYFVPSNHATNALAKFVEVATSNGLGGDVFTRKYVIRPVKLTRSVAQYPLDHVTYAMQNMILLRPRDVQESFRRKRGSSVVRHLSLVLEVPGSIPARGEKNLGVRTRFL